MTSRRRLVIAMLTFAALGMPPAAFGVAWPSAASELGRPLGDLGTLVAAYSIGYLAFTWIAGRAVELMGAGLLLAGAAWWATVALIGYAIAPSWLTLVVAAAVLGATGGVFDTALNAYLALEMDARAMNLVHAAFGLGAVAGPLLMTPLVAGTQFLVPGWRLGMAVIAALTASIAVALTASRPQWALTPPDAELDDAGPLPAGVVAAALAMFFLYTGTEVVAGQYSFTLLSEGRGVPVAVAGLAAGGFWLGLTGSRLALGLIGERLRPRTVLTVASTFATLCLVAMWMLPGQWSSAILLVLAGFGLGPFFPLNITLTPARMGRGRTTRMVGYQIGAAHLGAAVLPWMTGQAVNGIGLEVIAAVLAAGALMMMLADGALATSLAATRRLR